MSTVLLQITQFPEDLRRRLKVQAAVRGVTLRELVVEILSRALREPKGSSK